MNVMRCKELHCIGFECLYYPMASSKIITESRVHIFFKSQSAQMKDNEKVSKDPGIQGVRTSKLSR